MKNLWSANHPRDFWQCRPNPCGEAWQEAIFRAFPCLGLSIGQCDIDSILAQTLGEGRFGPSHWNLGFTKRVYYLVKPIVPRNLTRQLRRVYNHETKMSNGWVIDHGYVDFLWEVLRQLKLLNGNAELEIRNLWPEHNRFAFVLTHDIETAKGQEYAEAVADLEESIGFSSLFNFVPERYKLNQTLMDDLRHRGFEIGVHGLRHDGRLFDSKPTFMEKAGRINKYLKEWKAAGFRSELTLRQPEWMQELEIEYDLSFFDTDPFEPIPGGIMSIWPFFIGHFVELPYTLVQDYTLISVLRENSPRIWLDKVDFIEKYHGMALVNSHPDYLFQKTNWNVYYEFLIAMKNRKGFWHAHPREVANWWRNRSINSLWLGSDNDSLETVSLIGEGPVIDFLPLVQRPGNSLPSISTPIPYW